MKVIIRQEKPSDHYQVFELIRKAFENERMSDHRKHLLVEKLRKTESFIPELSLVADFKNKVVGNILLTPVKIKNEASEYKSLALAPVGVLPEFHRKGIGGKLIETAHRIAMNLNFGSIVLPGHEEYYPKFGYLEAEGFGIKFPFEAPSQNCMVKELKPGELKNISGSIVYPEEFFE